MPGAEINQIFGKAESERGDRRREEQEGKVFLAFGIPENAGDASCFTALSRHFPKGPRARVIGVVGIVARRKRLGRVFRQRAAQYKVTQQRPARAN